MNSMTKKIMIYSLAGIMQLGLGASVIEASPLHNEGSQNIVQLDDRYDRHDRDDRYYRHDQWQREENERHEREIRRHHRETDREWRERQEREHRRHDERMRDIEAGLIGIVIGSSIH